MKKLLFIALVILVACEQEITPPLESYYIRNDSKITVEQGTNGRTESACGHQYQWDFWEPYTGYAWGSIPGGVFGPTKTTRFDAYMKPLAWGSTMPWPTSFGAVIRVNNNGRQKLKVTPLHFGSGYVDIASGGYYDFYYYWDQNTLGNIDCNAWVTSTLPIGFEFYRYACGSTSGTPWNGHYYSSAEIHVISINNGHTWGTTFAGYYATANPGACTP